jgi:serine/threonine-protein kinase
MPVNGQVQVDDKAYQVDAVKDGGMGRVWLLRQVGSMPFDPVYRRRLAVKTFDYTKDEPAVERELNIWISLDHPAILAMTRIGRLDYRLAAIMPRAEESLADLLERHGPLDEDQVLAVIERIASALEYSWSQFKLLHLDLKPSNVLLDSALGDKGLAVRTKVADWGIARLGGARARDLPRPHAASGLTSYSAGTPIFMAPERFSGRWALSPSADIYSLGLIAIQLCAGVLPFSGSVDPIEEVFSGAYLSHAAKALVGKRRRFRELCLACVSPDPSRRPASFSEVGHRAARARRGFW